MHRFGDAYMVAGGLPDPCPDHLEVVARLALAMRDEIAAIAEQTGRDWLAVRIGIDTGPASHVRYVKARRPSERNVHRPQKHRMVLGVMRR